MCNLRHSNSWVKNYIRSVKLHSYLPTSSNANFHILIHIFTDDLKEILSFQQLYGYWMAIYVADSFACKQSLFKYNIKYEKARTGNADVASGGCVFKFHRERRDLFAIFSFLNALQKLLNLFGNRNALLVKISAS